MGDEKVDFSDIGQMGLVQDEEDEEEEAHPTSTRVRRSTRRRRSGPSSGELSSYFQPTVAASKRRGSARGVEAKTTAGALKRSKSLAQGTPATPSIDESVCASSHATETSETSPSTGASESRPPSIFPSISLALHGLAADKVRFYGLVQEILTPDVFGMTIVCILLNQTTGRAAVPVFYDLMERYPTPAQLASAKFEHLRDLLQPIGLHNIRAKRLIDFATEWIARPPRWGMTYKSRVSLSKGKAGAWRRDSCGKDLEQEFQLHEDVPVTVTDGRNMYPATEISHLPGVGRYALDSFLLFKPREYDADMAAVQEDGCVEKKLKPTSQRWQCILDKREELGEYRHVGRLLPPLLEHTQSTLPHDTWRHLLPLDKELRAYLAWRLTTKQTWRQ